MKYLTYVALIYYFYWTALILFESSQLSNKNPDTKGIKQLAYYPGSMLGSITAGSRT